LAVEIFPLPFGFIELTSEQLQLHM